MRIRATTVLSCEESTMQRRHFTLAAISTLSPAVLFYNAQEQALSIADFSNADASGGLTAR